MRFCICALQCVFAVHVLPCLRINQFPDHFPVHVHATLHSHVPGMRLSRTCTAESARSVFWRPSMAIANRGSRMASPGLRIAVVIPHGTVPLLPRPACSPRRRSAAHRCRRFHRSDSRRTIAFSSSR